MTVLYFMTIPAQQNFQNLKVVTVKFSAMNVKLQGLELGLNNSRATLNELLTKVQPNLRRL